MEDIERLLRGELSGPHAVLGAHPAGGRRRGIVIRVFDPEAEAVSVIEPAAPAGKPRRHEMRPVPANGQRGLFEAVIADRSLPLRYELEVEIAGRSVRRDDPYRF